MPEEMETHEAEVQREAGEKPLEQGFPEEKTGRHWLHPRSRFQHLRRSVYPNLSSAKYLYISGIQLLPQAGFGRSLL